MEKARAIQGGAFRNLAGSVRRERLHRASGTAASTKAGTPYCITVDFETLEDQSVTVRHRDSMQQERVAIDALERYIRDQIKSWQPEA